MEPVNARPLQLRPRGPIIHSTSITEGLTMTKTTTLLITLTVLTAIAGAASAQTTADSLRCEARKMRAESQYYACQSRCDRRADRVAARPAERRAEAPAPDCDVVCTEHFDDDMARIESRAPCATITERAPNPKDCEAHMLRLSASALRCQARCGRQHREGYDPADCLATCQTRCETATNVLNHDPICSAGRIGDDDACAIH
jgi:hypothetical protein